jgi:GMP synthase-like glutamine amidotransferase
VKLRAYVRNTYEQCVNVKWVGICFGHQILSESLGGKVEKNPRGWEVGWCPLTLLPSTPLHPAPSDNTFSIMQMHQDHVTRLPPHFINLARTEVSENQVMMEPGRALSIQSHPEFTASVVTKLVKSRHQRRIFTDEQAESWLQIIDRPTDGEWFAHRILDFLLS